MADQLLTRQPTDEEALAFLADQSGKRFSYPYVGATAESGVPDGYSPGFARVRLGQGRTVFEAARAEMQGWRMFDLPWVQLYPVGARPVPGTDVALVATWLGLWSMNALRVVYAIDEPDRAGFATGTLPGHLLAGEERFLLTSDDDGVFFEISSFSRPDHPLASLGLPVLRWLQQRFRRESTAAIAGGAAASIG